MDFSDTALNADFIKNYMPKAPAMYTLVYICSKSLKSCNAAQIAAVLNISESEAACAVSYWNDRHLLEDKAPAPQEENKPVNAEKPKKYLSQTAPVYSPQEIAAYADKNRCVRELFDMAQEKLGKLLTQAEMNNVFSLYDWLGMNIETIEILLDYCVSHGHKNMRYIERVAVDWCESGFSDAQDIKKQLENYNTSYRAIMKAFGQNGRDPVAAEEKFMMKWVNTYEMPLELILMACEKTVMNTGKAAFRYADSILTKWHSSGFKLAADVEAAEKAFTISKKTAETTKQQPKPNKFNSYTQRQYDYEKIEKLMGGEIDK